ncbi:MAG: Mrp/NBP35 family ATP-binding protein [Desulfobacterales bacterium]|nr:Mrp/NBP35 family ATP-binding protein [Desulfobacterales bacterium]
MKKNKIQDLVVKRTSDRISHKLLVMSGKGGVGKSSVAACLSLSLADRRFRVGLLDVDLNGPSIAKIMGLSGPLQMTENRFALPHQTANGLKVLSMQFLLAAQDRPVIWRGPAKTAAIRQFMADVQWGDLDFLLIDSPPGTGDEPLAVARNIAGARAVIVTTPQQVAIDDVKRAIRFCRTVSMPILGMIENMGPFACPFCGRPLEIFKTGGGRWLAKEEGIEFLGTLPFDPKFVEVCDAGRLPEGTAYGPEFADALSACVDRVVERTEGKEECLE